MKIDDLTIGEARQLTSLFGQVQSRDDSAWEIGKIYLIRTVTMIDTGYPTYRIRSVVVGVGVGVGVVVGVVVAVAVGVGVGVVVGVVVAVAVVS